MFRGNKQGGGGGGFVNLTGLFRNKKDNGYVGSVKLDEFETVRALLDECESKEVELVFFVGENEGDNGPPARLSVAVGRPYDRPARKAPRGNSYTPGRRELGKGSFSHTEESQVAPRKRAVNRKDQTEPVNPPKDELDDYLEQLEDEN